jgi:hypothetical protein
MSHCDQLPAILNLLHLYIELSLNVYAVELVKNMLYGLLILKFNEYFHYTNVFRSTLNFEVARAKDNCARKSAVLFVNKYK